MKPRTANNSLLARTAEDLMSPDVLTIPQQLSMREAAKLLHHAQVTGAPVVDELDRCVGVLSAMDVLRWVEDGCPDVSTSGSTPCCPYQEKTCTLCSGEDAVVCALPEGSCPLQAVRSSIDGRSVVVCRQPEGILSDWQQVYEHLPEAGAVRCYMTTDVVSAELNTPLIDLALMMVDAHIHRILVLDEGRRPVGVISSTDILAACCAAGRCSLFE